jgi:hypothetical protein
MSSPREGGQVELGDSASVAKGASWIETIQKQFQKTTFGEIGQYRELRMDTRKSIRPHARAKCTATAKGAI